MPHEDLYMPFPMSTAFGSPSLTGIRTLAASTVIHFGPSNFSQQTSRSLSRSGSHIRFARVAAASRASAHMPTSTHLSKASSAPSTKNLLNFGSRARRLKSDSTSTHSCGAQYLIASMQVRELCSAALLARRSFRGTASISCSGALCSSLSSSYLAVVLAFHHSRTEERVVSTSVKDLLNLLSWNTVSSRDAIVCRWGLLPSLTIAIISFSNLALGGYVKNGSELLLAQTSL
mmetsp:Transcript_54638/g.143882  ORF Transcript_54638/g.143882 Transcript_54638/m.143882 type:complete len:232 (-) Transcript_54638:536-1231(-)